MRSQFTKFWCSDHKQFHFLMDGCPDASKKARSMTGKEQQDIRKRLNDLESKIAIMATSIQETNQLVKETLDALMVVKKHNPSCTCNECVETVEVTRPRRRK